MPIGAAFQGFSKRVRRGFTARLKDGDETQPDPDLLQIIMRAHDLHERLIHDPKLSVPAVASQEQLTIGYLSCLLRLPSLAPDIVMAIINGKHPPQLSAKRLTLKLPTDWAEQRKLLGFPET